MFSTSSLKLSASVKHVFPIHPAQQRRSCPILYSLRKGWRYSLTRHPNNWYLLPKCFSPCKQICFKVISRRWQWLPRSFLLVPNFLKYSNWLTGFGTSQLIPCTPSAFSLCISTRKAKCTSHPWDLATVVMTSWTQEGPSIVLAQLREFSWGPTIVLERTCLVGCWSSMEEVRPVEESHPADPLACEQ